MILNLSLQSRTKRSNRRPTFFDLQDFEGTAGKTWSLFASEDALWEEENIWEKNTTRRKCRLSQKKRKSAKEGVWEKSRIFIPWSSNFSFSSRLGDTHKISKPGSSFLYRFVSPCRGRYFGNDFQEINWKVFSCIAAYDLDRLSLFLKVRTADK